MLGIVKTSMERDGVRFNPVSAFLRPGCWPHGPKTYMASIRLLGALFIIFTMGADYGFVDSLSHFQRTRADGDYLPYFFRPQEWVNASMAAVLLVMFVASDLKRVDSEMDEYKRTFLFIWNVLRAVIPLAAVGLIMFYGVVRDGTSQDQAFEAVIIEVFIMAALELLWGGWKYDVTDVALPMLLGALFVAYTALLGHSFNVDLYPQLDWRNDPSRATVNSFFFMLVVLLCGLGCAFVSYARDWLIRAANKSPGYATIPTVGTV